VRWRLGGDRHVGRPAADRPNRGHHRAGDDRGVVDDLDLEHDRDHFIERLLAVGLILR
jgi:hypothetical protein